MAQHEAIHKCDVLALHSLIKTGLVTTAITVGGSCETEHWMRVYQFTIVFWNTERLTIQDAVQTSGGTWFK